MRPGEVALLRMPQPDLSPGKLRPVLVLSEMPGPFADLLVCGISSQIQHEIPGWDERLTLGDEDFITSGLKVESLIRLNWLAVVSRSSSVGTLGSIGRARLNRLAQRLAAHVAPVRQ
jgi:mRNA interferase MazF